MKNKTGKSIGTYFLQKMALLVAVLAMIGGGCVSFRITTQAATTTVTSWDEIETLVANAKDGDVLDVSSLIPSDGIKVDKTLVIDKDITFLGNALNGIGSPRVTGLSFNVNAGATLTLQNMKVINITNADAIIRGEGNVVIKDSIVEYDAPPLCSGATATIDITGDITVYGKLTGSVNITTEIFGYYISNPVEETTANTGVAIRARNVKIYGGCIVGGCCYGEGLYDGENAIEAETVTTFGTVQNYLGKDYDQISISGGSGKNGGNGIVATKSITLNGGAVIGGEGSAADGVGGSAIVADCDVSMQGKMFTYKSGKTLPDCYVKAGLGKGEAGIAFQFKDNNGSSRKLIANTTRILGEKEMEGGYAAPYTFKMNKNDIAILDNCRVGWYPNIPIFSGGYYHITNPISTVGTFDNATYIENPNVEMNDTQVTANASIPNPTYTVTIPATINFGEQSQALEKYANADKDQYGKDIKVSIPFTVSAQNVNNLFDDLGKKPQIDVAINFNGNLTDGDTAIIPYTVKNSENAAFTSDSVFCSFTNTTTDGSEQSKSGTIWINRTDIKKTASYTGSMTFNISIPDAVA